MPSQPAPSPVQPPVQAPLSAQPRAFRLDLPDTTLARGAQGQVVEVVPEPDPIEPAPSATAQPGKWPSVWAWFAAALTGLIGLALGLWVEQMVRAAMAASPVLGAVAVGLAAMAAIAVLVILARAARDLVRQRRIDRLQGAAQAALETGDLGAARRVATAIVSLIDRPDTAQARARFTAAEPDLVDARDVLVLAERELVAPLDRRAAAEIARAARQVSLVTAVSPRALIDLVFVLYAGARVLGTVARIYGGRPGLLGLVRLARAAVAHLLVTGGLAAGDALMQQVLGQGMAARVSAKLGEGVLNGLMTARLGLAAMAVCRPIPVIEQSLPTLGQVAAGVLASQTSRDDPADGPTGGGR